MAYRATMQDEIRKGPWVEEEDEQLSTFVSVMGERRWDSIAKASGLRRSGKSCRLRWLNYLRPDLKHGQMTIEEECLIVELQERWGNKWSKIARRLPGRTDNEVKNYWRTHLRKKAQAQEQEKLQREIDNVMATKRFLLQEIDLRSSKFSGNENILNETENSGDGSAWSDSAFAYSPDEAHLCDWVSETLQDQDVLKYHGELDVDIWDYSADFLWDYGLK